MKAPARNAASSTGAGGCRIIHTPNGNVAAARIEAAEMKRVTAAVIRNTSRTAMRGNGVKYKNAPMNVDTAFPPLNFKNTGKAWPAMTASAARLVHEGELSVSFAASQTAR